VAVGDSTPTRQGHQPGFADDSNVQSSDRRAGTHAGQQQQGTISGNIVTLPVVPKLASKQSVSYKIVAKGVKAATATPRSSCLRGAEVGHHCEESTTVY